MVRTTRSRHSAVHLALLLIAATMLAGCSLLPASPPITLGATDAVRASLVGPCKLAFAEQSLSDGMTLYIGTDPRSVYTVALIGTDDVLMHAAFTVTPEREPSMWRPNYIDRCLVRFLAQIGQAWLQPWYYEHLDQGEANIEVTGVRATLLGGAGEDLVLEVMAMDSAEQLAAVGIAPPAAAPTPGDAALDSSCGTRVVARLGGQRLNLRAEPGTDATIVAKLTEGTTVRHLCATQEAGGRIWASVEAQVDGETVRGWASEEFLRQP